MNCFGLGGDSPAAPSRNPSQPPSLPVSPPQTPGEPSSPGHRPKYRRKGSLSSFLGSLLLSSTSSSRSRPPSPPHSPLNRRSWSPNHRVRISHPILSSFESSNIGSSPLYEFQPNLGDSAPSSTIFIQDASSALDENMDKPSKSTMLLHPATAISGRMKQVKDAQDMGKKVQELARKSGVAAPQYEFLELIGKGSFGRVYKGRRKDEQDLVAVKIIDVDRSDYKLAASEKDSAIQDFLREIQILHTLKDSKAKNINKIHEAFNFHSQLWIVSEYCPGGSVHTLMKASGNPGLEEKYIVAISRELALALKYVHDAGIIHRDIKAANVLITQDGQLQLCDFGVSGILENNVGKRSTIIGTPCWMAPELLEESAARNGYGTEVDCWAYGCTIYELATGLPPNANVAPHRLPIFLKRAPRLEGDKYSAALKEFVSFCLEERPEDRPNADKILKHIFVTNTSKRYPTVILRHLIERFATWESAGGQRASLFQPYGATASTSADPFSTFEESDEWNFSATDDFAQEMLDRLGPQTPDLPVQPLSDDETPKQRKTTKTLNPVEKYQQEQRANRGAKQMARLFDESADPYEYSFRNEEEDDDDESDQYSDLPFRRGSAAKSPENRETIIDLDAAFVSQDVPSATNLADVETIKAKQRYRFLDSLEDEEAETFQFSRETKRFTRDWKFPTSVDNAMEASAQSSRPRTLEWTMAQAMAEAEPFNQVRPPLMHTVTEPVGTVGDFVHPNEGDLGDVSSRSSMIDLDEADLTSLQRQASYTSISGYSSNSNEFENNQFYHDDDPDLQTGFKFQDAIDLEDPVSGGEESNESGIMEGNFAQNQDTLRAKRTGRTSLHMYTQSEPNAADRPSSEISQHNRASSLSSDTQFERMQRENKARNADGYDDNAEGSELAHRESNFLPEQVTETKDWWTNEVVEPLREPLEDSSQQLLFNGSRLKANIKYPEYHSMSNDDSTEWDEDDDDTSWSETPEKGTGETHESLKNSMNNKQGFNDSNASHDEADREFGNSVGHKDGKTSPQLSNLASRRGIGTAANAAAALTLSDSYSRFQSEQHARARLPRSLKPHRAPRGRTNVAEDAAGTNAQQPKNRTDQIMTRFPNPLAVDPEALEENANPALMEAELSRLLDGFMNGLGVARELIEFSERNPSRGKTTFMSGHHVHNPATEDEFSQ